MNSPSRGSSLERLRFLSACLIYLSIGCTDPYEAARDEKLAHNPGCDLPFGTPAAAHVTASESVSELKVCDAPRPWGIAGFVILKGAGRRSAYGDIHDPVMANDLPDPAQCMGEGGDFQASRAFWSQVDARLRERLIVTNGSAIHEDCAGKFPQPRLLALRLFDWADLDATLALVQTAMREHDICSPIALEVAGLRCVTLDP